MHLIPYILLLVYSLALLYITVYCLMQIHLLYYYTRYGEKAVSPLPEGPSKEKDWPMVTIQLPIFNERFVVERLLKSIIALDYPKDRMEIHVLDDSIDDTVAIAKKKVEEYFNQGYQIKHIHRIDRTGFKAGALKDAMPEANGEFIAIFDADFLPNSNFLKKTIPHFQDEKIGVVQTRWEHINKNYSLLTRLQAMQLDVHFSIEQKGRLAGNCLLQFNGTAGVWRRTTIDQAGGWEADTLTEDLDLSYRAQLKGWKIIYLEKIGSPSELPAEMNGLKSQQFRWQKGGAETAKKMLPTIWRSAIPLRQKMHATSHLLGSSIFVCVLISAVLSVPLMLMMERIQVNMSYAYAFYSAVICIIIVYYFANVQALRGEESYGRSLFKFIFLFPIFLCLSMGLSLHNTIAVVQGYLGKKSAFVRTPKFGIQGLADTFKKKKYLATKISWVTIFEGGMSIFFLVAACWGYFVINQTAFLVFHLMLFFGFGGIFYYSIRHLDFR